MGCRCNCLQLDNVGARFRAACTSIRLHWSEDRQGNWTVPLAVFMDEKFQGFDVRSDVAEAAQVQQFQN